MSISVQNSVVPSLKSSHQVRLMSVGRAARFAGVCENTIRANCDAGKLESHVLPSGHRRLSESALLTWLGRDKQEEESGSSSTGMIPLALCVRVSSRGQDSAKGSSDKSSLDHQAERIQEFVKEKFGERVNVKWYRSVGSGLNYDRKELLELVDDILAGKLRGGYVISTDFTRLMRFGISILEKICSIGGCQIIYSHDTRDTKNENETLVDDILSIMTCFTARISGNKNRLLATIVMDDDSLKEAYILYQQGWSYRKIADRFASEGRTNEKGQTYSHTTIYNNLKRNRTALEQAMGVEPTSLDAFWGDVVRKKKGGAVEVKSLKERYLAYCKENDFEAIQCKHKFSRFVRSQGLKVRYDWKCNRRIVENVYLK